MIYPYVMAIVVQVFSCPLTPVMTGMALEIVTVVLWTGDCIDNTENLTLIPKITCKTGNHRKPMLSHYSVALIMQ